MGFDLRWVIWYCLAHMSDADLTVVLNILATCDGFAIYGGEIFDEADLWNSFVYISR